MSDRGGTDKTMRTEPTTRRDFLKCVAAGSMWPLWPAGLPRVMGASRRPRGLAGSRPNIVFILADDMAYKDLSAFGQKVRKTPHLDRLALGGIRFTQAYAGASMCAPSRAVLMTGMHLGHCRVRHNASLRGGQEHLLDEDVTVAEVLKQAGYRTAMVGKWGIGLPGTPGEPHKQGFDLAYGFYDQRRAHSYYPEYLMRNGVREPIPANVGFNMSRMYQYNRTPMTRMSDRLRTRYDAEGHVIPDGVADPEKAVNSQDLIHAEALRFIRANKDHPFFLYYATQIPHGPVIAESLGRFRDAPWDQKHKEWAAMIDHLDRHVGELVACLEACGVLENTIIFFASDNGYEPSYLDNRRYEDDPVFHYKGPWPGGKFSNREGGLRVPCFVYWKGRIRPGTSDLIMGFQDFLPTAAALAGVDAPAGIDGISIVPELEGRREAQPQHPYLYWEHDRSAHSQSVRMGRWHAFRPHPAKPMELYDIVADPECRTDLAAKRPEVVRRIARIMTEAHRPSRWFVDPGDDAATIAAKKQDAAAHPRVQPRHANLGRQAARRETDRK